MTNEDLPVEAFPPGDLIREEIAEREWTQSDLAMILGKTDAFVSEIIAGKRGITPQTAQGLADAFGTSAQWWMNMETSYRLALRTKTTPAAHLARLFEVAPAREMIKR